METKRFIGNDMPRIYARVKREFGADAVIVRTRSLFREGAEPLIEVIAAPPESSDGLPFDLQQTMVSGALDRATNPARGLTIGDLEDLAARQGEDEDRFTAQLDRFSALQAGAESPPWLEGYVGAAPGPAQASDAGDGYAAGPVASGASIAERERRDPILFPLPDVEPAPSSEWAGRPRPAIVTRPRRAPAPADEDHAMASLPRLHTDDTDSAAHSDPAPVAPRTSSERPSAGPGLFGELVAAGLSSEAAQVVARSARPGDTPAMALAACLEARDVRYPGEHHTALITIQGPVASGRTTALMRMALDCADSGRPAFLVAADGVHVAAREQVRAYGEAIGLDSVSTFEPHEVIRAATRASVGSCLFIDTPAGTWDSPPIAGIPHFAYLALPAHWSRSALDQYVRGVQLPAFAGVVLTFSDVATDLSPVISLLVESALGIAFLSSSRDVSTGIQVADPLMLASGIFTTPTRESTNGRLSATA